MALKFGTSGIRGLVSELTDSEVYLLTTAFLTHARSLNQEASVAIAQDLRESSPRIQRAVVQAAQDFGFKTLFCGQIPTPALAYFAKQNRLLGIMITGSHIPADRNGIKFYLISGETLKKDDEAIYGYYEKLKATLTPPPIIKETLSDHVETLAQDLYRSRYLNFFKKNVLAGLRIVFYQHSSVARDIFPEILEKLGATVIRVGLSNSFIPVDTEAIEALDQFKLWIEEHHADALISTDGDGDRPLVVDCRGQLIPGDKIGALTSLYLGCEAIALPISCNSGIATMKNFRDVKLTKIGSPFVVQALRELATRFEKVAGFEANGGYLLQSDLNLEDAHLESLPTRDSVLPVLAILALAKNSQLKTDKIIDLLPPVYTASGLIKNFAPEKSAALVAAATKDAKVFFSERLHHANGDILEINTLDGVRCRFSNATTIHLRPSGNAPEFRCYVEANTQEHADELCLDVLAAIPR